MNFWAPILVGLTAGLIAAFFYARKEIQSAPDELSPDLAVLTELRDSVQEEIDELKQSGLTRKDCHDDYDFGHRNGRFFVLCQLRKEIKEEIAERTP